MKYFDTGTYWLKIANVS